jgi:hypothetical protein
MATYEVRVRVRGEAPQKYEYKRGCFSYKEIVKMFHKEAHNPQQAMERCQKYGTPISARKVDTSAMFGNFEKLPINNNIYVENNKLYVEGKPYSENNVAYSDAINKDEMVAQKRNKRRDNMYRDKTP